jgi:hypothetical protein
MPNPQPRVISGYWGHDLRCRVKQEMTLERTRALLQDQLLAGGLRAYLWQSVVDPRNLIEPLQAPTYTLRCSCVKKTGESADRRCKSCHGISFIPGYLKFGNETIWFASISPDLALTNVQLNTITKPNRIELVANALSGTIETPDVQFIRTDLAGAWEARCDYVQTDSANSAVLTEFSTDRGSTWTTMAAIASVNPESGLIRFRITLMRNSLSNATPSWEILRARYTTVPIQGRMGPWIMALKSVQQNRNIQDLRGIVLDANPSNFWTAPLSLFDCSIPDQGGVGGTLDERNLIIDPAFIQFLDGVPALLHHERWSCTNLTYSDPFAYLTKQNFQARLQQEQEFTGLVF